MIADENPDSNVTPLYSDAAAQGKSGQSKGAGSKQKNQCATAEAISLSTTFNDTNVGKIAQRLVEHMNLVQNMCYQLENIADSLPDSVDRQSSLHVARSVVPVVRISHDFEETVLFPLLRERCKSDELEATLERLQGEHFEDESYAEEVQNGLVSFANGVPEVGADSLSYMLRGFFEGMRRHLAFERAFILPLLRTMDAPA